MTEIKYKSRGCEGISQISNVVEIDNGLIFVYDTYGDGGVEIDTKKKTYYQFAPGG